MVPQTSQGLATSYTSLNQSISFGEHVWKVHVQIQRSNLRIQGKVSNAAVNTLLAEKIICLKTNKQTKIKQPTKEPNKKIPNHQKIVLNTDEIK